MYVLIAEPRKSTCVIVFYLFYYSKFNIVSEPPTDTGLLVNVSREGCVESHFDL